jgi:hypothetical protein
MKRSIEPATPAIYRQGVLAFLFWLFRFFCEEVFTAEAPDMRKNPFSQKSAVASS